MSSHCNDSACRMRLLQRQASSISHLTFTLPQRTFHGSTRASVLERSSLHFPALCLLARISFCSSRSTLQPTRRMVRPLLRERLYDACPRHQFRNAIPLQVLCPMATRRLLVLIATKLPPDPERHKCAAPSMPGI